jgi:hypothetical protein
MQEVVIKTGVDLGDSPQQVQSLRSQYTELFKELGRVQEGSAEYYAILKKTAAIKGEMRELREEIKALDPREQIRLIGGLAKSAAGGFEAATGAVALFAGKNEELEKTLLKVNAAIAVTHGLQEFTEGARRARALWGVFTGTLNAAAQKSKALAAATKAVTAAQKEGNAASVAAAEEQKAQALATDGATLSTKLLGGALKALGIGLIIAAIAYLVDNWKELKKQIMAILPSMGDASGAFDKFKNILVGVGGVVINLVVTPIKLLISGVQTAIKVFEDVKNGHWGQIFTDIGQGVKDGVKIVAEGLDFVKNYEQGAASSRAAQADARRKEELEKQIKFEEDKVKVMEAGGQDSYRVSLDIIKKKKELYADDEEKLKEVLLDERVLRAEHGKMLAEEAAKAAEKAAEAEKKYEEEQERIRDEHAKRLAKIAEEEKDEIEKNAAEALKLQTEFIEKGREIDEDSNQRKLDKLEKEYALAVEKSKGNYTALIELQLSYTKQKAVIQKEIDEKAEEEQQKKYEAFIRSIEQADQNLLKSEKNTYKEKIEALRKSNAEIEGLLARGILNEKAALQAKKVNAEIEKELNKQVADSKKAEVAAIGGALNALSGIVAKNSVVGKAIAVGQATINTYQGATLALASAPPPYSYIEAAAITAAGLANVRKIIATKVGANDTGGGSASVSGTGGAGIAFNAPAVPQSAQTTNLSQSSIDQLNSNTNSQNQRVYVSESDITGTQVKVASYGNDSTLN